MNATVAASAKKVWTEAELEVCHSLTQRQLVGSGGLLDGENLLPAFRHPIADLFEDLEWE